jgi:hypothetical protein
MSDIKQPRPKRPTPAPETNAAPEVPSLPEPPVIAALPAPTSRLRPATAGADVLLAAYRRTLASVGESQSAVASDVTAMALEMNGLARASLTAASETMVALFGAKSLANAVEIQLGFARRSLDALAGGSTKLGELGLRLATDATRPMLAPFAAK